jgi:hypothetical protein
MKYTKGKVNNWSVYSMHTLLVDAEQPSKGARKQCSKTYQVSLLARLVYIMSLRSSLFSYHNLEIGLG